MLVLELVEAADAAAEDDAAAVRVFLGEIQTAVGDGLDRGHQGELAESIQMAGDLGLQRRHRVELLHLPAKVDLERGGVELLDRRDAALAREQGLPVARDVRRQRVDRPQTGDDDAPRHFLFSSRSM